MFYLMMHSTHFILRLYGVGLMVKDHSDSERGNLLPPHGLLFPINSKGSFICTIPHRVAHTTAFITPVVEDWLEREIAQWVHPTKDRSDDPSYHERTLLPQSYRIRNESNRNIYMEKAWQSKKNSASLLMGINLRQLINQVFKQLGYSMPYKEYLFPPPPPPPTPDKTTCNSIKKAFWQSKKRG